MRTLLLLLLLTGTLPALRAQGKNFNVDVSTNDRLERKGFEIGLGGFHTSLQDVRFSRVRYAGTGLSANLGHRKRTKDRERWFGLSVGRSNMGTSLNELASIRQFDLQFAYEQQRPVGELLGAQWLVGGELRAGGNLFIAAEGGNNSSRIFSNAGLTGLTTLRFDLGGNLLSVSAGLGLLHYAKDGQSFAFSLSQSQLEDGAYSYEDSSVAQPFVGHRFYTLTGINQFRGRVSYQFGRRLAVNYRWEMTRFSDVKNYPTTQASHFLGLGYTF